MTRKILLYPDLAQNFPSEIKKIFTIFLQEKPDSIRLVGGCVRDMLLKNEIKDYDFATSFLPQDTIKILAKNDIYAVPTGIKFGTVTAVINLQHYEITTLRKDNKSDGRHCEPEFIDDYLFDAARRDFTINALYLDAAGVLYDYFDGIDDLQAQKICFIGEAKKRIEEDFLRIMRFFRFSARYAKSLDKQGLEACIASKYGIKNLSADRLRNEFFRILQNPSDDRLIWILSEIKKSQIHLEILSNNFNIEQFYNFLKQCKNIQIKPSEHLKFAALFLQEKLNLDKIYQRLNFSNVEKKYFSFLFNSQSIKTIEELREFLALNDKLLVRDFYLLDAISKNIDAVQIKNNIDYIKNFSMPQFELNGNDLLALGLVGKNISKVLNYAKKQWILSDFRLSKQELINLIKNQAL